MKNYRFLLLALALLLFKTASADSSPQFSTAGFYELPQSGRTVHSMNPAWRFYKGSAEGAESVTFDDSRWEVVSLPHGLEYLPTEASGCINYQGEAGCGQHAKLANQIMIAGTLTGVCEALSYAKAKGLDMPTLLKSVSTGAAGSKQLDTFGPKILEEDYAPGFFMKHFIKDMKLALVEANISGLSLEMLSLVLANYEELEAEGLGDLGTQALMKYYEVQEEE